MGLSDLFRGFFSQLKAADSRVGGLNDFMNVPIAFAEWDKAREFENDFMTSLQKLLEAHRDSSEEILKKALSELASEYPSEEGILSVRPVPKNPDAKASVAEAFKERQLSRRTELRIQLRAIADEYPERLTLLRTAFRENGRTALLSLFEKVCGSSDSEE